MNLTERFILDLFKTPQHNYSSKVDECLWLVFFFDPEFLLVICAPPQNSQKWFVFCLVIFVKKRIGRKAHFFYSQATSWQTQFFCPRSPGLWCEPSLAWSKTACLRQLCSCMSWGTQTSARRGHSAGQRRWPRSSSWNSCLQPMRPPNLWVTMHSPLSHAGFCHFLGHLDRWRSWSSIGVTQLLLFMPVKTSPPGSSAGG